MNKAVIIVTTFIILGSLVELRPRHRHRSWHKYFTSSEESSESDSVKSCTNCTKTNIGNGYKNHNVIYYKSKSKKQNTKSNTKRHHRHRYESDESDESDEQKSYTNACKDCTITNIGNGEHNYNIIYYR